jgi:hypothetical protein
MAHIGDVRSLILFEGLFKLLSGQLLSGLNPLHQTDAWTEHLAAFPLSNHISGPIITTRRAVMLQTLQVAFSFSGEFRTIAWRHISVGGMMFRGGAR